MLCENCNENLAVVFIKNKGDDTQNKSLCMSCAKELGHDALPDMMKNMGLTEEMFDEINLSFKENPPELDPSMFKEALSALQNMMPGLNLADMTGGIAEQSDDEEEEEEEEVSSLMTFPLKGQQNNEVADDNNKSEQTQSNRQIPRRRIKKQKQKRKAMEQYCINLTDKAAAGEIDRVIGRDKEILRVTQILNRRSKNNPVLIGEPGVGKTAIAEGLALKIVKGEVPHKLMDKEIHLLDMATVVAGTQFRGQFESRLKNIIDEAKASGNVIFVIDELHTIVGAGDAEGAIAAGNILKPALAKGQIQVIGATTLTEYRKSIEKDAALERRFQSVIVEEPSEAEAVEIIKGIKDYFEDYHSVRITDEIIEFAVSMSKRYINGRFLPDKAIDLIDEAGSNTNLYNPLITKLANLRQELADIQEEKESIIASDSIEAYRRAAELKINECKLNEEIDRLTFECENIELTKEDIATVIELWTNIPVKSINDTEQNKLLSLEERLHKRVIAQNVAVSAVSRAVMVNRANLANKKRPVSFIFVGPTGVGKTELVKQLCTEVFHGLDALIRLDMSEYMEKHTVSRLIGSPPGYVGYDDAGQLTEKVRRHPYSLILLDEIEKAHFDIFNILLQILDDGRITDSQGRTVNFENCIIVMTSNAGSDENNNALGFNASQNQAIKNKMDAALKKLFRPEFLNRVDEIVYFDMLGKSELHDICRLMLSDLQNGLKEKGITVTFADELVDYIVEKGYDPKYGARPMRRVIYKEIEGAIAHRFINGDLGSTCNVTLQDGKVNIL